MKKIFLLVGICLLVSSLYTTPNDDLFHAVALLDTKAAQKAINADAKVETARNKEWETPLHKAAFYGKNKMAAFLLDNGADVNAKDRVGLTPLHIASDKGNIEMVHLFLNKGANPNVKTYENPKRSVTPLHNAAANGHEKIVRLLVNNGAKVDDTDIGGSTALHMAAIGGHIGVVRFLSNKIDPSVKDNSNITPLHFAALKDHVNIARYLISKGANINVKSLSGHLPIDLARSSKMKNLLKK